MRALRTPDMVVVYGAHTRRDEPKNIKETLCT
ncbi:hypothetical protein GGR36_000301 [Niveibacterium umoris]|uniref:Uncharacterized protein n=1 Tax=Niveibacterium umoris TaxID=1193620 RepID=A0A840BE65_9RHOO|nr:hypothetical protein [Niveibacterium umoris]